MPPLLEEEVGKDLDIKGRVEEENAEVEVEIIINLSIPPPPTDNDDDGIPIQSNIVRTVITNPPFGTKHNAGIDISFLRTATIRLATKAVYSFHKSSTRSYLVKIVQSWGYNVEVIAQMKFDIPKMYKFHKLDEVDVEVDLFSVSLIKQEKEIIT